MAQCLLELSTTMGEMLEAEELELGTPRSSGLRYTASADWVGVILKGTYEVVRKIATGGMGSVYEARHARLGHRVAVKLLRSECADDAELLHRFRHEATTVAHLGHPHIVTVFDVNETEDGQPFLVMELIDGETLADRLDRSAALTFGEIAPIALQIASALACTHAHGIVHRDLKPDNVMLLRAAGETDFVKVLDFGISKTRGSRITDKRYVLGTPAYMAPEQVRQANAVDHRADQYALCAILYEALSGEAPHGRGDPTQIVLNLLSRPIRPLNEVEPQVPRDVADLVMRGLSFDPDARFRDVSQLAWAIENALEKHTADVSIRRSSRPAPRVRPRVAVKGANPHAEKARSLLASAQTAYKAGRIDDAVAHAEEVVELAAYRGDAEVYDVVGRSIAALDCIFETRVGGAHYCLERAPVWGAEPTLSSKATALLELCTGRRVGEVLSRCGFPRRDGIRMLAGLLRRGLVVAR